MMSGFTIARSATLSSSPSTIVRVRESWLSSAPGMPPPAAMRWKCNDTPEGASAIISASTVGLPGGTRNPSLARQPIIAPPPAVIFPACRDCVVAALLAMTGKVSLRAKRSNPDGSRLDAIAAAARQQRMRSEPKPPILAVKEYDAASVFEPANLLREARRQKRLAPGQVPSLCLLDPDGDILRALRRAGRATLPAGGAGSHTDLDECGHDAIPLAIVAQPACPPLAGAL